MKEPIAVIGMSCRFPKADNVDMFWRLMVEGVDAIGEIPPSRFDVDLLHDPVPKTPGKIASREGGFLENIDMFDAQFFGISPREANTIDPQQRLLLETAWEALEDAGQVPEHLSGSKTGVFVAMWTSDYEDRMYAATDDVTLYMTTGGGRYAASGRLSYFFNLNGPSLTVDTACSSSLVAMHLAAQSLWDGESTMALVGGVNLLLMPQITIGYSRSGMLSPDGRCKFGDVSANGYVRSEGAGMVVLKPLTQAMADGDRIHALIRGSAVNNDGRSSDLLVAPSPDTQALMLRDAYRTAGVSPAAVQYVEAHGTGTPVGDPVELTALGRVLGEGRPSDQPCMVGSVKTNIGHTEAASGIAGFIKAVLCLKHRMIPPSLHMQNPNPNIPWAELPLDLPQSLIPWPDTDRPAYAGVNSFGITGTNAHIVLEAAPAQEHFHYSDTSPYILPLSAHSPEVLAALARAYQPFLTHDANAPLYDIAYNTSIRRTHLDYRLAVVGTNHVEIAERLGAFLRGDAEDGLVASPPLMSHKIAFIFPGQGGQWAGMGRQLLEEEPVFREAVQRCEEAIGRHVEWSLLAELQSGTRLDEIDVIQPMLFAIQVSLTALWRSWGVEPDGIIGHSMGEVAGACVAGILSLEDAAHIICKRSRLMKRVSGQGAMAVVGLSYDDAYTLLAELGYENRLGIAVNNGPRSTVLSGDPDLLETVLEGLRTRNIFCRAVNVDVAAHSPHMESLKPELVKHLQSLQVDAAAIPIYSTVTGTRHEGEAFDSQYWGENLRQPVLFADAVQQALEDGFNIFIEIGPHPVLLAAVEQNMQAAGVTDGRSLASMRREENERGVMLEALGGLYASGYAVDWTRVYPGHGNVVSLPSLPWQRERYWIESENRTDRHFSGGGHPLIGRRLPDLAHAPGTYVWENRLDNRFARHIEKQYSGLVGETVFEAMALTAMDEISETKGHRLIDLQVQNPLSVEQSATSMAQIAIVNEGETCAFRIFSREVEAATWTEHATGRIQIGDVNTSWLYELRWIPQAREQGTRVAEPGRWLIFADEGGTSASLAAQLAVNSVGYTLVYRGDGYAERDDNSYTIHPGRVDDYKDLFADVGECRNIVYLWGLDLPETDSLEWEDFPEVRDLSSISVVYLVQALVHLDWSESASLWLVTRGAVGGLRSGALTGVAQASLWGMGRTIALEHPNFWGGLIDLPVEVQPQQTAEWLLAELNTPGVEDQIAYAQDQRYVARLERFEHRSQNASFEWRSDATYLITGGLRGLGLMMAGWLVDRGVRHLALIGRGAPSDEAQHEIADLEKRGAKILVVRADVSNHDDMVRGFDEMEQSLPPLKGVIHCAAVIDNGVLVKLDYDHMVRVMASKVEGTWNLHTLTRDILLDCFVTFSSFASLFGIAGEGNYAAANAFVDSLMQHRNAVGLPGLAVNWGTWDEIGRAMEMRQFLSKLGLELMSPRMATAALPYLLQTGIAEAVVADVRWDVFGEYYATQRRRPFLDAIEGSEARSQQSDDQPNFAEVMQKLSPAEQRKLILHEVRNEAALVLGFKPAEKLDVRRGFFTLGMDSLMSVQLRNRLANRLSCFLPPTVTLEYPTVEALTGYVANEVFKLGATDNPVQPAVDNAAANGNAELDALSQDALLALLDDEMRFIDEIMGDD